MRVIENKTGKYDVYFTHYRMFIVQVPDVGLDSIDGALYAWKKNLAPHGGHTTCLVAFHQKNWRKKFKLPLDVEGKAVCSLLDKYDAQKGERLSLARAIRVLHPDDRGKREAFWEAWDETSEEKNYV